MKRLQNVVKRYIIKNMKFVSHSVNDTYAFAKKVADKLKGGEVIILRGDLGAGKTTFTKGLAKALGVEETVTSPTFTYVKEYYGRLPLYHFDMYRVADADEVYELGLEEYFYKGGVVVVEWNKFDDVKDPLVIDMKAVGEGVREFEINDERIGD